MDEDVHEFLTAGVDTLVTKPMKAPKLDKILDCFSSIERQTTEDIRKKLKQLSFSDYMS
jgi:hypothetical protein